MKNFNIVLAALLLIVSLPNTGIAQCPVINCTADLELYLDNNSCEVLLEYENPSVDDFCFSTTSFHFTGNEEIWIVPEGVHEVLIDAYGAQGGHGSGQDFVMNTGGRGAYVRAMLDVTPGDTLFLRVGGKGEDAQSGATALGGWNGGGNGGFDSQFANNGGAGGGGATDVRIGGSDILNRVLVAAGGGGAAKGAPGGGGGDPEGFNGFAPGAAQPGMGAVLEVGGAPFTYERGATAGYVGMGGDGSTNHPANGGGGGGAGLYGGSGGTSTADHQNGEAGGGGGGSSFYHGTQPAFMLANEKFGDGLLTIYHSDPDGISAEKLSGPESGTLLTPGEYQLVFASFSDFSTSFCHINVTVSDTMAPTAVAQNITVYLDENNMAFVQPEQINNGSTDNCEVVSMSLNKQAFTNNDLGSNEVELTVTDASGNSATTQAIVTVKVAPPFDVHLNRDPTDNGTGGANPIPTLKSLGTADHAGGFAEMKVYPNPANNWVQLSVQLPDVWENVWLIATAADGRRTAQINIPYLHTNDYLEFSVADWIPGIYIVQLTNANESVTQRLVVR